MTWTSLSTYHIPETYEWIVKLHTTTIEISIFNKMPWSMHIRSWDFISSFSCLTWNFQSQMQTFTVDFSLYKIPTNLSSRHTHIFQKSNHTHSDIKRKNNFLYTLRLKSAGDSCAFSISFHWGKFFSAECVWLWGETAINNLNLIIQWRACEFLK